MTIAPDDHEAQADEDLLAATRAARAAAKKRAKAKPPVPQETAIQRAIIGALRWHDIYCHHSPNEGKRSARGGKFTKALGMRSGFPDLACYQRGGRHGLLEVKRPGYSPSDVSDHQRDMHARMRERGIPVAIVTSIDDAIAAVRAWGWVK